ncbi:MAG: lysophospholipid acyltransferase family protein [Candidatus Contendobacter sp.]|nr:lysophospholipid acyltransferase family protein [Candidatus Contendobacter sp.]
MNQQALLTGLLRLTARLSLPVAHAIGAILGGLLGWFPNPMRRVVARNLALAFPDMAEADRDRLLHANLMETGKLLLELGPLWLWPGKRVLALARTSTTTDALTDAVRGGQGAIVITPHLGSWEMAGLYYSSHYPMTILYRPSRLGLDELSVRGRGRLGAQVVATDAHGVRALLTALRRGQVLGILPDQDPGPEGGVFAPFFDVTASTMTLVSRLALKTGVPVFLTWAERLPHGQGYTLHLRALPEVTAAASLEASAAALNRGVEAAVRTLPTQYLWAYKRFKTRPPGEAKLY